MIREDREVAEDMLIKDIRFAYEYCLNLNRINVRNGLLRRSEALCTRKNHDQCARSLSVTFCHDDN